MIQGFEQQTSPLTDYERTKLLPVIVKCMRAHQGRRNMVAGSVIIAGMRRYGYKIDGPRLRKIINHIRTESLIPCLASSGGGYFVAETSDELDECIASIEGRIASQQAIIDALKRQRPNLVR